MSGKRPRDETEVHPPEAKKPRKGFRVGPDNLEDGPWRRKVIKKKKDLIHRAKVKKAYAKIKAQHAEEKEQVGAPSEALPSGEPVLGEADGRPESRLHPERQAMLESSPHDDEGAQDRHAGRSHRDEGTSQRDGRRHQRPGYFDKQLKQAEKKRREAEQRAEDVRRRGEERERKVADRQKFRKAMGEARKTWPNGQRRLGRESVLLLEKVRRLVAE